MAHKKKRYTPALRFHWLTSMYEPMMSLWPQTTAFNDQLIKQAALQPNQKILDIGCGPGTLLREIKTAHPDLEVTGLDIDSEMLAIAQAKSEKEGLSISYKQGFSDNLSFPDASFDHVFSSLLFHHLSMDEKQKTILEMYRILKKGGRAHILDFGRPDNLFMRFGFFAIQLFDGGENVKPHGEGRFVELLIESPFTCVVLTNRFNTPLGTLYTYQLLKNKEVCRYVL